MLHDITVNQMRQILCKYSGSIKSFWDLLLFIRMCSKSKRAKSTNRSFYLQKHYIDKVMFGSFSLLHNACIF